MTSLLARHDMPPARTRFFLAVQGYTPTELQGAPTMEDITLAFPNGYPGSVLVENTFLAPYPAFSVNTLLKDLGRQIKLVSATGTHLATYREVQRVAGAGTEGVGPAQIGDSAYGCFFVKVWSADGQGVYVVRTG